MLVRELGPWFGGTAVNADIYRAELGIWWELHHGTAPVKDNEQEGDDGQRRDALLRRLLKNTSPTAPQAGAWRGEAYSQDREARQRRKAAFGKG